MKAGKNIILSTNHEMKVGEKYFFSTNHKMKVGNFFLRINQNMKVGKKTNLLASSYF